MTHAQPHLECPHKPTATQAMFLACTEQEVFFGGAAGGGKSDALLMAALQFVHVPGYAALILRKDTQRLSLAGGLIPRSHAWLADSAAKYHATRRQWIFPTADGPPATLTFGFLASAQDKYRYQSSEFQFIAFDELTELPEEDYLFLFSRLRRTTNIPVPLRVRAASNPGNIGHLWVKQRFVGDSFNPQPPGNSFNPKPQAMALGDATSQDGCASGYALNETRAEPGGNSFNPKPKAMALGDATSQDGCASGYALNETRAEPGGNSFNAKPQAPALGEVAQADTVAYGSPFNESANPRVRIFHHHGRVFIPSRIADNPHLDEGEYRRTLSHLPPVARERLLHGDWSVCEKGVIEAGWLRYYVQASSQLELLDAQSRTVAIVEPGQCRTFVTVDPAGTSADKLAEARGRTASYTVAQVWHQPRGTLAHLLILRHQVREQVNFDGLCDIIRTLHRDWQPEKTWIENEKFGQAAVSILARELPIAEIRTESKDKLTRAARLVTKLERGEVFLPRYETAWRPNFEAELLAWTGHPDQPADQIDAAAYAAIVSERHRPRTIRLAVKIPVPVP